MGAMRALPAGYNRLTTAAGVVTRRTRPMSRARAEAFAKCLNANYHFAQAQVVPLSRGSNRFFVAYLPADPDRQNDVFAQYVQQQVERAALEMEFYDFKPDGQGGWFVKTLPDDRTGHRDTYHVTADCECDCPHYRVRLRKAGVHCKHCLSVVVMKGDAMPRLNSYRIENGIAYIDLCTLKGELVAVTKVDESDLPRVLALCHWYHVAIPKSSSIGGVYPWAVGRLDAKQVALHRFIIGAEPGVCVDHINRDTLDNRRSNLRIATKSENAQNTEAHRDSQSGFKNVYWDESRQQYAVQVCLNRQRRWGGYFADIEEAKAKAEELRRELHPYAPENSATAACQPVQPVPDPTPTRFNRYAPVNNGSPLGNAMYGATEENPFGPVSPLDDLDTYFAPAPVAPPARPRPDINKDFG